MAYPPRDVSAAVIIVIISLSVLAALLYGAVTIETPAKIEPTAPKLKNVTVIPLPEPRLKGDVSLEEAIFRRRSIREYTSQPLTLSELGQILWAAQGITEPRLKFRAAPSAGATYPLELYVVVKEGGVEGLRAGIYHYDPYTHSIQLYREGDYSYELYKAALEQRWVLEAPVNIVIMAVFERTTKRYGERGVRYVYLEAGHVGQNIYLQATALGLGTVAIGAFYDDWVQRIIGAPSEQKPIYIFPVGHRR